MDNIIAYVRAVLSTTPARWQSLTETLPADLLRRPPAPNEWSALECLQHLVDTEQIFSVRVRHFLAGQDFPAFDPDTEGTRLSTEQSPSSLAATFARYRAASLDLLAQLTPGDLARSVRHSELGPVTLGEMLHEWAAHDLMHTVQAERALMQPFIAGCGPWRPYFTDHTVA
ncbi:MAG: hypothetical protein KatS3mg057_1408 [Herpetosiphonaceae bacterium]|nr:MAG: hypothetical protein KatS3mg057_1408 [Herpetosiphonaceae bacterium]